MRLSDEQLMAYVDGESGASERAVAEFARKAPTAEETRQLDDFRRTRDLVRAAFKEDEYEPVPAELVAMILGRKDVQADPIEVATAPSPTPVDVSGNRVISIARSRQLSPSIGHWAIAAAASVALGIVVLAQWHLGPPSTTVAGDFATGPVAPGSTLASVLERHPSGEPVVLDQPTGITQMHVMAAATFRDRNARFCREVELLDSTLAPRKAAVACRDATTGTWTVEGTAVIAQQDPAGGSKFAPAGAPAKDALAALLSMMGAEKTLPPDDERRLLDSGWK